jgi:hypothetical protein
MKLGTWNVRNLYGAGSVMTFVKELPKFKEKLVGVHNVGWDRGVTKPAGECTLAMERETRIMNSVQFILCLRESYH